MVPFHSLPGSKRYAECAAEMALILSRQNDLLDRLIGEGTPYALLYTGYGGEEEMYADHYSHFCDERLTLLFTLQPSSCVPDPFFEWRPLHGEVQLYARQQPWRRGAEDALLAAVADDEIHGSLLFCPDRDILFAPYDGGFTVVASSASQREALEARFGDWLPGSSGEDATLVIASALPGERQTVRWLKEELDATVYLHDSGAVKVVKVLHRQANDDDLRRLGALSAIERLMFVPAGPDDEDNPQVTDRGLQALHGLSQLESLNLEGFPAITEAGVRALRAALPGCTISD